MRGWLLDLPDAVRRMRRGRLVGPVVTLASGAVAAQAVAYAARPALTRLFTPEDFGVLAFYAAAAAVPAVLATGRYEGAVMLPEREVEAARLFRLALGLALGTGLATLALLPLRTGIAAWVGHGGAAAYLPLLPLGLVALAWTRAAEVWLTRRHRYRAVSASRVAQNAAAVPIQLGAGVMGLGAVGLVAGFLTGRVVALIALLAASVRESRAAHEEDAAGSASTRALAVRYSRFPLLAMPSGLLNTLSMQLPALLLLALVSAEAAGYFGVAYSTLAVPMQLVGGSVAQVFFGRAAEAHRAGGLAPLTRVVARRLALVGAFPLGALLVVGPASFSLVFGSGWREAGVYAQALAPWLFLVFVGSPLSTLFDVLERQKAELGLNAALTAARAAALAGGAQAGGAVGAVTAFGVVSAVLWAGQTAWLLRWAGLPLKEAARLLGGPLALAAATLILPAAGRLMGAGDPAQVAAAALAGLVYVALALPRR